jgi:hypothetical protein
MLKSLFAIAALALAVPFACAEADPPPVATPDPPRIEKRVADLEAKVAELERALGLRTVSPAPVIVPVSSPAFGSQVVPPGHHAHQRSDGTIIVHGDWNHGDPVAHQGVPHPWPKIAVAGQVVPQSFALPGASFGSSYGSACPGGSCPAPQSYSRPGLFRR